MATSCILPLFCPLDPHTKSPTLQGPFQAMSGMFTWVKRLILLSFVVGILAAGSYAGAWFQVGKFLGDKPPLGGRTAKFAFGGTEDLSNKPRVWVFKYSTSQLPGVREATIYVSPTGKVVATRPANLGDRIDAWARSLEP